MHGACGYAFQTPQVHLLANCLVATRLHLEYSLARGALWVNHVAADQLLICYCCSIPEGAGFLDSSCTTLPAFSLDVCRK